MVMVVPMVAVMMPGSERGTSENDEKQRSENQLLHGSTLALKTTPQQVRGSQRTRNLTGHGTAFTREEKRKLEQQ
jgi:hypothetical protein